MTTTSPRVCWITGVSGAGKTTIARAVVSELRSSGVRPIFLDGDELREVFDKVDGHDRESRLALAMRYARLCQMLARQGFDVVIATISLFKEVHAWNRAHLPGYFEVYLQVPLDELKRRDPKGIYKRYDAGLVTNVAGLDLAIDVPSSPDFTVNFNPANAVQDSARDIVKRMIPAN